MEYKQHIVEDNLSIAWLKALKYVYENGDTFPLMVTIDNIPSNLEKIEILPVREKLDNFLKEKNQYSVRTVANTIFPWSMWNPNKDRIELYKRHFTITPSIKTCHPQNTFGHYFRRMIAYDTDYEVTTYVPRKFNNQLDHIIETWNNGNHRHTALQVGIFDAERDHVHNRRRGFPCLQQVSFDPFGKNGKNGLGVTGFYPTQLLIRKAYGNYLGLCRLGYFMAQEMGLKFTKMNCIISKASIERSFTKKDQKKLVTELYSIIN